MPRGLFAWLLTIPLAIAGTQIAHALAYRIVTPAHQERAHELSATGHGYMAYLPLVLAIGTVLVVFALVAEARHIVVSPTEVRVRPRAWHFAVVAPALFFCQEHFERLLHSGGFPWHAVLAESFLAGIVLQLPFALAAYVVARLLLRATHTLGRLLARPRRPRLRARAIERSCATLIAPRIPALALGYGSRGPPRPSR